MGTTLTAAKVHDDEVGLGHVGDSRAYILRDGELRQLTRDHSLVAELERTGQISAEAAEHHPQRSIITRALGPEPEVEVDTYTVPGRDGDVFLICSDGLTGMLADADVEAIVRARRARSSAAAEQLVDAANQSGGRDNITVVLFRLEDDGGGASTRTRSPASRRSPGALHADEVRAAAQRRADADSTTSRRRAPPLADALRRRAAPRRDRRRRAAGATRGRRPRPPRGASADAAAGRC